MHIFQEAFSIVEENLQKYFISTFEAQQIIFGVNFLISNHYLAWTYAERLRLKIVKLAIQHKIDPMAKLHGVSIEISKDKVDSTVFSKIITSLKRCINKLEKKK